MYVDPADVTDFVADVRAVAVTTQAEPGCLFYGVTPDDAGTGRMLLAQRWRDPQALARHLETAATIAFQAKWQGRLRLDVQQYTTRDAVRR
jgi:quinol monooxygenase YgiN